MKQRICKFKGCNEKIASWNKSGYCAKHADLIRRKKKSEEERKRKELERERQIEEKKIYYRRKCFHCGKLLVTTNPYQRVHKHCRPYWEKRGKGERSVNVSLGSLTKFSGG